MTNMTLLQHMKMIMLYITLTPEEALLLEYLEKLVYLENEGLVY